MKYSKRLIASTGLPVLLLCSAGVLAQEAEEDPATDEPAVVDVAEAVATEDETTGGPDDGVGQPEDTGENAGAGTEAGAGAPDGAPREPQGQASAGFSVGGAAQVDEDGADAAVEGDSEATSTAAGPEDSELFVQPSQPPEVEITDHESVVGGFGIGLLDRYELRNLRPGGFVEEPLGVSAVGVRWWISERMGLQFGAGFSTRSGTQIDDIPGREDVEMPTLWGVVGHFGVPISLYDDAHYNLVLVPEVGVGWSTGRTEDDANIEGDQGVETDAWLVSGGLKAGAEVQFGFIDLPMLALQGSIGVRGAFRYAETETVEEFQGDPRVTRRGQWSVEGHTTNFNDPWDVFTSSISALYYFK